MPETGTSPEFFVQQIDFRPKLSIIGRKWIYRTKGVLMRSFDYSRLYNKAWDTDILNLVAKIYEHKGRQDLFIRLRQWNRC